MEEDPNNIKARISDLQNRVSQLEEKLGLTPRMQDVFGFKSKPWDPDTLKAVRLLAKKFRLKETPSNLEALGVLAALICGLVMTGVAVLVAQLLQR